MTNSLLHVAYFKSMFDNVVEITETRTWSELVELFSTHRRTDTKNDLGFILGRFKDPSTARAAKKPGQDDINVVLPGTVGRVAENIVAMDALCIDYDGGAKIDDVRAQLSAVTHLGYTSYNHLKDGTTHKFRVVIPFTTPCPAAEWKVRNAAFLALFPGCDKVSFTLCRIFYAPSTPTTEDRPTLAWNNEGEWLDWTQIAPVDEHQPRAQVVTTSSKLDTSFPEIHTVKYGALPADELFELMTEGYANRLTCFRLNDPSDRKAGCFVQKLPDALLYYGNDGDKRIIRVLREELPITVPVSPLIDSLRARTHTQPSTPTSTLIFSDAPAVIELNERYLPSDLHLAYPERGVVCIKSPKGSGKTEHLGHLVAANRRAHRSTLLIGHRIHLLRNLSARTGLDNYLDLGDGELTSYSAVCLNSLASRTPPVEFYDTIIIDEVEQVLQSLIGDHLRPVRNEVCVALFHYIKHARLIVCLDADLTSSLTIEILQQLRGTNADDEAVGIINTYPIGKGRVTRQYLDEHHLLHDAMLDLVKGEKVFYTCNGIGQATTVASVFQGLLADTDNEVLLVTSATGDDEAVKAFIANPSVEATRYAAIVTSPTLSTGVSIDAHPLTGEHHFTRVYGCFKLNPGTYLDIDQSLCRVRDETVPHAVYIQANDPTGTAMAKDPYDVLQDIVERNRKAVPVLPGVRPALSKEQWQWAYIYTTLITRISEWSIFKPQQFRALRKAQGWTFEDVKPSKSAKEHGKGAYTQHKGVSNAEAHALAVMAAASITAETYDMLLKKKTRTTAENHSLERYRYTLELAKIGLPFELEHVVQAISENLIGSLRFARTHLIYDTQTRTHYDSEDRKKNTVTFTDNRTSVKQNELLLFLCASAGLDFATIHRETQLGTVEVTSDTLTKVANAYVSRQRDCNLFFGARIKDPTHPQSLAKVWNATIGKHTIPLTAKRVTENGQKVRRYFINTEAARLALKIINSGHLY